MRNWPFLLVGLKFWLDKVPWSQGKSGMDTGWSRASFRWWYYVIFNICNHPRLQWFLGDFWDRLLNSPQLDLVSIRDKYIYWEIMIIEAVACIVMYSLYTNKWHNGSINNDDNDDNDDNLMSTQELLHGLGAVVKALLMIIPACRCCHLPRRRHLGEGWRGMSKAALIVLVIFSQDVQ